MAELFGGAFLSSAFQVLLDRLANLASSYFGKRKRNDDDVEKLRQQMELKLMELNAVLDDAEKQQITNQSVKDWLDELKHVVYQADDLLDEIATKDLKLNSEAAAAYQSQVRIPTSETSSSASMFEADTLSKIEEILDKLEYFSKQKDVLGLKEKVVSGKKNLPILPERPSTSLVDESVVFGRDDDKEKIIQLLLSDDEVDDDDEVNANKIDVIPIVGMGGLGKTTLAQLVYNDGRVKKHFETKAWACVSDDFDVFGVTKTILEAVSSSNCDSNDLDMLQIKLKDSLTGKKFLIVLDDVWNENPGCWDILRAGKCGSKIIVTTRNISVADIMQTVPVHYLQQLSHEVCWSLIAKIAFHEGDSNPHPDLEKIGMEISKKCKGLPLAAKTLAGTLRSKLDVEVWDNILKSDIWDLPEGKNNILPALRLSYYYLPRHLKQCFAYCSIFPKDYEFEKERLVLLWMAQNFVQQPKNKKTLEEVGDEYFRDLRSRSFFQPSGGKNSCFVMHDLVHDLAQVVSENFFLRLDGTEPQNISTKVRHFSYVKSNYSDFSNLTYYNYDGLEKFKAINELKCLRTFLPLKCRINEEGHLSEKVLNDVLPTKQCLRVLSLSYYLIKDLPDSIGNLMHLRFLDLSYTRIKQLPVVVYTLYNLQTLLLSHCGSLTTLPGDIVKLLCLRHLDIIGTKLSGMPMQMSQLKGLQHLTAFVVGKSSGSGINELKEFHHLSGPLSISRLQNVTSGMDALEANLNVKKHLEELLLEWDTNLSDRQNESDVLEKLQPHTNLKSLVIKNYGGTSFLRWVGHCSYTSMATLRLDNCKDCVSLPPLGQMSCLKHLTISRMDGITKVGPEFYGNDSLTKPFPSLETLRFEKMLEWVEWNLLGDGEFFHLRQLYVIKCPKLVGGLPKDIPSWVRLEINECPRLMVSVPRTCTTSSCELVLKGCDGVEFDWQGVPSLANLEISCMLNLKELTSDLCRLTNIKELRIEECTKLLSLPRTGLPPMLARLKVINCKALLSIFESSSISGCSSLVTSATGGLPPTLKSIYIDRSPKLVFPLFEEIGHSYTCLESLRLRNSCDTLKCLPLGLFPKLEFLMISSCKNFETFSIPRSRLGLQNLTSLKSVHIFGCPNVVSLTQGEGLPASYLTNFSVRVCKKLKALPERMHTLLPSLGSLTILDCPEIESFPDGGLPSGLCSLVIEDCKKLVARRGEWGLQKLPSLREFSLTSGIDVQSFPEEGLLPSTLTSLEIFDVKSLNNSGLQLLSFLEYLGIRNCRYLQCLPEDPLPASLSRLQISDCPLLEPRCQRNKGDDWKKIAHIPIIEIEDEVIVQ